MVNLNDAYEIARYIKEVEKKTPVKIYVNSTSVEKVASDDSYIFIGDYDKIMAALNKYNVSENDMHIEFDRRNSAIPLKNTLHEHARIEPWAIIRDMVTI